jgi:succinate-semialdehyde dehydrogenase / glutarate-semialdehyde dehydrogenase
MGMQTENLVDGKWVPAASGARFEVIDPGTDELVATVPDGGEHDARVAVDAASAAFPAWRARPADERAKALRRMSDLMLQRKDELAVLLTREQGKPFAEARTEIVYAASFFEWSAEEARRVGGEYIPAAHANKRIVVMRQPVGVVAAITPWNFPAAMITRKLGPALAVGCTVVIKPAEQSPLTAIALGAIALAAGIPAGVVNVVTGDPDAIGRTWLGDARVRKLSFTGSTEVGRILIQRAATHITRLSLELGGHAPMVVFDDADVDVAVRGAIVSKFRNAGQTCICPNRFYVQRGIHDAFVAALQRALAELPIGYGLDEGAVIGPLIDDAGVAKVREHIADAQDRGATLRAGGKFVRPRAGLTERFCQPTLLDGLDGTMKISTEETFGPVVAVRSFGDEAEAIALANDSPFGLAAYLYTRDLVRALRVAEALETGIVGLNDGAISTAQAPFGGMKASGWGREGGKWAIDAYVETKYVSIAM